MVIFTDPAKAEQLRAQNARDDNEWSYTVDVLPGQAPRYAIGTYDETGRFIGYL